MTDRINKEDISQAIKEMRKRNILILMISTMR